MRTTRSGSPRKGRSRLTHPGSHPPARPRRPGPVFSGCRGRGASSPLSLRRAQVRARRREPGEGRGGVSGRKVKPDAAGRRGLPPPLLRQRGEGQRLGARVLHGPRRRRVRGLRALALGPLPAPPSRARPRPGAASVIRPLGTATPAPVSPAPDRDPRTGPPSTCCRPPSSGPGLRGAVDPVARRPAEVRPVQVAPEVASHSPPRPLRRPSRKRHPATPGQDWGTGAGSMNHWWDYPRLDLL